VVLGILALLVLPAALLADGGAILHTSTVHRHIAREAARVWPSANNPTHELWSYLDNGVDVWGYYDGDDIVEGAWEADYPNLDMRWMEHFWDADNRSNPYNYGYDLIGVEDSAYWAATGWWNAAIAAYPTNRARAYYCLGNVTHYLEDMSVPEHVKLHAHVYANTYEGYIGGAYGRWTATSPQNLVGKQIVASTLPVFTEDVSQGLLFRLFYHLNENTDGEAAYGDWAFGDRCYGGDQVDRKGGNHPEWKGVASRCPLSRPKAFLSQGDRLMPLAIRYVAGLFSLFWDATHAPAILDTTLDEVSLGGVTTVADVFPVDLSIENEGGGPETVEAIYRIDSGDPVPLVHDADTDRYFADWDTSDLAADSVHTVTVEATDSFGNTSIVRYAKVRIAR
jgi:hypothetical protein